MCSRPAPPILAPGSTQRARTPVPLRLAPRTVSGNLWTIPGEVNSFIGRDQELARLRLLQNEARLLTLVGPGGVGKTRLALRLETELRDAFPEGTWLIDLSPIAHPSLVPQAVGDVVGVRLRPGQAWLPALVRALRRWRALLLIDNCEHLLGACAELADGLLRGCPELSLLATSLQPLGAAGETTWRVSPLAVPAARASDLHELGANEAVRLFLARVRAQQPDFALGERNAQVVAEICRQLDGLPLALELVAARVEGLGLAEVGARLGDRFALAIGARRTAPARQRTLLATLEWSWGLLDQDERVLLRRLGVFVGSWTLEAASAVCSRDGLPTDAVVDVLARLVSKSLAVAEHGELTVRYRLLETVRAYALGRLEAADETQALGERHAAFFLHLAEHTGPLSWDAVAAALLQAEEGNVRAALEWTLQHDQAELGLRLAAAAFPLWVYSGHFGEGRAWLERLFALSSAPAADAARAIALATDAQLLLMLGDVAGARARGESALEVQQVRGDVRGIGLALTVLGNIAMQLGDLAQAGALHANAAQHLREAGAPVNVINLVQRALVACELGEIDRARHFIGELETVGEMRSDQYSLASATFVRGLVAVTDGHLAAASGLFERALAVARATHNRQGIVVVLTSLGHVLIDQEQHAAALAAFAEAMQLAYASGERVRVLRALEGAARALSATDADAAVRLAGATDSQRHAIGIVAFPSERRYLDRWLADARDALGPSAYQRAWDDGHASTVEQAVGLAEALMVAPAASSGAMLSAREQEVARLLARGLTNRQVAAELMVSPGTVRSHVEHILNKLDLRSRAQVAVWISQQDRESTGDG